MTMSAAKSAKPQDKPVKHEKGSKPAKHDKHPKEPVETHEAKRSDDERRAKQRFDGADEVAQGASSVAAPAYLQNRELSWLSFNERVLDQGADETVPLLERLNFISIFWSNLREFFMVRVGSLTDLSLVKKSIVDSKSGMTPAQQLDAIYARCRELYPVQERTFQTVRRQLAEQGIRHLMPDDLAPDQREYLHLHLQRNVMPFLSPQIINSRHPFPHLENSALYVVVGLGVEAEESRKARAQAVKDAKKGGKQAKGKADRANLGAEDVSIGLLPLPRQCERLIALPGDGLQFVLLEHALETIAGEVFSMYEVKETNVVCVTRNADLDATEAPDEDDDDYREHMKRILKKRARLAPVRLESERPLSSTAGKMLLKRLGLKSHQAYVTSVPLDLSYTWQLASRLPEKRRAALTDTPFAPQWPSCLDRSRPVMDQVCERDVLLSYPYETFDAFVQLLREAATDPTVISLKITLYRLARQSHLAEALIAAAENGKEVTALFELRARFDETNNIEWSQRFEQAGCNVIYGFRDFKVHSKICCITRTTESGLQHITQLGTGNYNEKTAGLYTDLSFITADAAFGRDAVEFFRNMQLENTSDNYDVLSVAPLQIKPMILRRIDQQIALAGAGEPCGLFFKTNSITDIDVIEKLVQASQAGVPTTLFVRGISCIVPGLAGYTHNIRVVSIVGRLLEHSRIYGFGPRDSMKLFLSSADLMTRNMDKRIEIAWPVRDAELRERILGYLDICLSDTAKLRELLPDRSYTALGSFAHQDENGVTSLFESQEYLIRQAQEARLEAAEQEAAGREPARRRAADFDAAAETRRAQAEIREVLERAYADTRSALAEAEGKMDDTMDRTAEQTAQIARETEEPVRAIVLSSEPIAASCEPKRGFFARLKYLFTGK